MKKLSVILCVVMLAALMLPLTVGAVGAPYEGDQTFNLQNKTPTIDGKIDANEGWSNKGVFDETHTGRFLAQLPLTSKGEFYFTYDNDGLYFAYTMKEYGGAYTVRFYEPKYNEEQGRELDENVGGMNYPDENAGDYEIVVKDGKVISENYPDMTEDGIAIEGALMPPSFEEIAKKDPNAEHITCAYWTSNTGNTNVYSTDADGSEYGWDGDVFALSFDPFGDFRKVCSSNENYDKAPQFNVGIFEGNVVKVNTSRYSNKEIEGAKGAGSLTEDTITFEVMIPWDAIVEECNACAKAIKAPRTEYTKELLLREGATHRAAITHMDRFDDPEAGYVDNWGRCITVCNYCDYATEQFPEGVPGVASSGDGIKSMGLKIVLPGTYVDTEPLETSGSSEDETEVVTDEKGNPVTDASGKPVTQKKTSSTTKAAGTNGKGNGSGSAQTFDAGIAVALGAVATSAIGFYYSKKKH